MTTVESLEKLYKALGGEGNPQGLTIPEMITEVSKAPDAEGYSPGGGGHTPTIIPTIPSQSESLTYNKTAQSPTWSDYDSSQLQIGGVTEETDAGSYVATFTPKSGYCWEDGTKTAKSVTWTISAKSVAVPEITNKNTTYDGTEKSPSVSAYSEDEISVSGDTAETNAGSYTLVLGLTSKTNYVWVDTTTEDKSFPWSISPKPVTIPTVTGTSFTYDGSQKAPTVSEYDSDQITVSGDSATNAGSYTLEMALTSKTNYVWSDETTTNKEVAWVIAQMSFATPAQDNILLYTGQPLTATFTGYDSDYMTVSGDTATAVGTHTATFTLIDTTNTRWAANNNSSIDVEWTISDVVVQIPTVTDISFTYDGTQKEPTITGLDVGAVDVSGETATNAGSYLITFSLKDSVNTHWSDNTTADKTQAWSIAPKTVTPPTITGTSYTYDGTQKAPTIAVYDPNEITVGGDTTATNAGSYTITLDLTSTTNYKWNDDTTAQKTQAWSIAAKSISVPTVTGTSFTYDGTAQGPTVGSFDPNEITQGGTASETNAGSYAITFDLVDTANTQWTDTTTAQKSEAWTIARASMAVPSQSGSLTYDGTSQSPTWSNYDSSKMTMSGDTSGTNAGTYTASFTPGANYKWSDDSTTVKNVDWTIGKATGALSADKNSVTLDANTLTDTVTLAVTGDGTVSSVSSDASVATASVSGNTVTISSVNNTSGNATITISLSATTNYTAPQDVTVAVTASFSSLTIVPFSSGTDEQLGAMLDAAAAGDIDLQQDGNWAVGDVRTITVDSFTDGAETTHSQQSIDVVITSFAEYMSCGNLLQVDFMDALSTGTGMNTTNTNVGGYGSCTMKTITLPALANALPTWMKDRLIEFDVLASAGDQSTTIETVTGNKLALRSEIEVFGSVTRSQSGEGVYVPYYTSSTERIKNQGHSGNPYYWWLRSPVVERNNAFCDVGGDGKGSFHGATMWASIAPFMCLGGYQVPTVAFATGTDAEIGNMIDAAQAGLIDLSDTWSVGDTRTISVGSFTDGAGTTHSQQDIDIVITSFDEYNNAGNVVQIDFKDALVTRVRMNTTNTNVGGYSGSEMKTTTLPALANALPTWMKDRLIEFDVLTSAGNQSSTIETVTGNKLALRSEVEIFGSVTYSVSGEGSHVAYYNSSDRRKKKQGHSGSSNGVGYSERSPKADDSTKYCCTGIQGGTWNVYAASTTANTDYVALAPFGCL